MFETCQPPSFLSLLTLGFANYSNQGSPALAPGPNADAITVYGPLQHLWLSDSNGIRQDRNRQAWPLICGDRSA